MKHIKFTYVDAITGISVAKEPARNGPVFPAVNGLEYSWARESEYPTNVPQFFGTCPDDSDVQVDGVLGVFSEGDWEGMHADEMAARAQLHGTPQTNLRAALTAEYERRMQAIAAGYPPSERESWPVQTSEAAALIADPQAATPWIDSAAVARGVDRLELANRIVAKDAMYRVFSGTLSGVRQRIEDEIDAAGDDMAALQLINVAEGWGD